MPRLSLHALLVVLALTAAGCRRNEAAKIAAETAGIPRPPPAASAAPAPALELEPEVSPKASRHPEGALETEALAPIEVAPGEIAWVSAPTGARERRPIVVGVHGAGDRADWACSAWRAVVAEHAWVVCPQSKVAHPKWPNTFVWGSTLAIGAQAARAVAAVRARHGPFMDDGPLVYGGWSQGGTLASQVVAERRGEYDRVVLVEVGHTPLDADAVGANLVAAGIQRAVVGCESANCRAFATKLGAVARRRRLSLHVGDAGFRHHWFDEPMVRAIAPEVAWLVGDDVRFVGLGAAIERRWSTD